MVTPLQDFVDHDFVSLLSKPYRLYVGDDSDRDDSDDDDDDSDDDDDDDHDDYNNDYVDNNYNGNSDDGHKHVTHFIDDLS